MRKIQITLVLIIIALCYIIKFGFSFKLSYLTQDIPKAFAAITSDDSKKNQTPPSSTPDISEIPEATEEPTPTATIEPSEPSPSINTMTFNAESFAVDSEYTFSITLDESNCTDIERSFFIEVYADDSKLASDNLVITEGETSGSTDINVKFDKAGSFCTNVKIYDKEDGNVLLEEKGDKTRYVKYEITNNSVLDGIDLFANVSASKAKELKNKGISFIARYYSKNKAKCITHEEALNICNAGIQLVTVYQDKADDLESFSYENGCSDCQNAISIAQNVGQPETTPIYFAVDIDANQSNISYVNDYFKGVNDTMKKYQQNNGKSWEIGVYGSYFVVSSIYSSNLATYVWQTMAWSHNSVFDKFNIYQKQINTTFDGLSADLNISNEKNNNLLGGFYIKD